MKIEINKAPGKAAKAYGGAQYPDDFEKLKVGCDFCFWIDNNATLQVETVLPEETLKKRLTAVLKEIEEHPYW